MTKFVVAIAIIMAVGLPLVSNAYEGAMGVVKERMDIMKSLGSAMKVLKPQLTGTEPYDVDRVKEAARKIKAQAGEAMTAKFPEGSLDKPTEALPAIWQEWPRFKALAMDLEAAAERLEILAHRGPGSDFAPVEPLMGDAMDQPATTALGAFQAVADACGACHDKFRKPQDN